MFYVLSKVLFFLTAPSTWILSLLLAGLFLKKARLKKISLWASAGLFFFFTNEFILETVNSIWEYPMGYYSEIADERYGAVVVLGGYANYAPKADQVNFGATADRLIMGMRVVKDGIADNIVLAGGHGELLKVGESEASYSKRLLVDLGVASNKILIDTNSRNTYQNAVETERILTQENIEQPVLLITSCNHMIRAKSCFENVGIETVPFCVDAMADKNRSAFSIDYFILPNAEVFFNWHRVIHEWLGIAAYKALGYA